MARVVVQTTMSLDGFVAGPNHEMDWVFEHAADVPPGLVEESIASTGAVLGGRRGYEVSRRAERPETRRPFGGRWSGPIFILTHNPPDDETDPDFTFLSGDIGDAVATARDAAGERNVLVLGADIAGQCLRAGLVDEVLILMVPVLLGDGVRLFGGLGAEDHLALIDASRTGQVVSLRYRAAK
jgi:dihydrofolate reductase